MKKYLIEKTFEAEPMVKYEAEARLGKEVGDDTKEDKGFLTCDMKTLQFNWIPESKFEGKVIDSLNDEMLYIYDKLSKWQTFFRNYTKEKVKMSQDERLQIYLINRHLKAVNTSLNKILNINHLENM